MSVFAENDRAFLPVVIIAYSETSSVSGTLFPADGFENNVNFPLGNVELVVAARRDFKKCDTLKTFLKKLFMVYERVILD